MDVNLALGISTSGNRLGGFENIPRSTLNPIVVEPEFEPEVHWKETPEYHILVAHLPGFTIEDVRVHIDNWGNLIISGERRVEELVMVGGRMHRMERLGGSRFRKIFGFPTQNLNLEGITAKFEHEALYVWVPKVKAKPSADAEEPIHLPDEERAEDKHDETSEVVSVEVGSPAYDFESMEETVKQEDEGKTPERWRPSQEESIRLPDEERAGPKHDETSEAVSVEVGSPAYDCESREVTVQQEDEGKTPESWRPSQEINLQSHQDYESPEKENQHVLAKEGENFGIVEPIHDYQEEDEGCLPSPTEQFPENRIHNHSCSTSIFSKRMVMIASTVAVASTVVVLSVGLYLSYRLSLGSTEDYRK